MKYDEFVKLPIFKKGFICYEEITNMIFWYENKPKFEDSFWLKQDGNGFIVAMPDKQELVLDMTGINTKNSLREVENENN